MCTMHFNKLPKKWKIKQNLPVSVYCKYVVNGLIYQCIINAWWNINACKYCMFLCQISAQDIVVSWIKPEFCSGLIFCSEKRANLLKDLSYVSNCECLADIGAFPYKACFGHELILSSVHAVQFKCLPCVTIHLIMESCVAKCRMSYMCWRNKSRPAVLCNDKVLWRGRSQPVGFDACPLLCCAAVLNTSASAYGQCKHKCLCQPRKPSEGLIKINLGTYL